MPWRWLRFLLPAALLLLVVVLVRRTAYLRTLRNEEARVVPSPDPWTPIADVPTVSWVAPVDRACPPSHSIKAKSASGIYHLPGTANYGRTQPDRCYADEAAAVADGFTKAKR